MESVVQHPRSLSAATAAQHGASCLPPLSDRSLPCFSSSDRDSLEPLWTPGSHNAARRAAGGRAAEGALPAAAISGAESIYTGDRASQTRRLQP